MSFTVCLFVCLLFVCVCVCMVMDFSSTDDASGVKFCTVAHRRPGQAISHFCELCSPEAQNEMNQPSCPCCSVMLLGFGDSHVHAACGRRIDMCGYTSVPKDGCTCLVYLEKRRLVEDTAVCVCVCLCMCRNRILQDIERFIHPEQVINRVVYCLDETVLSSNNSSYTPGQTQLNNFDEQKCVYCVCVCVCVTVVKFTAE